MRAAKVGLKPVTDAVVSVVLIAAALTVIYRNLVDVTEPTSVAPELPSEPLSLEDAPIRGSKDAEAVMIVFADFECPFCARFAREVQPEIERRYLADGRVAVAFRHLPLPLHPQAGQAAVLAECAGAQGQFWEMHDRLFGEPRLDDEVLRALPESIGLDPQLLQACLLDRSVSDRVVASAAQARALGIRATPTFFFGRRLADGRVEVRRSLSGARALPAFIRELDATLGLARKLSLQLNARL